jgi:hypothetical protein
MNSHASLSPSVVQVLELFADALEGVSFPDIDREVLQAACERLGGAQALVAERQAALDEARAEVETERAALQKLAGRALGYARIFASDDPELLERIDGIEPPGGRPKRRRKKKAKKKKPADESQLALAKDDAA